VSRSKSNLASSSMRCFVHSMRFDGPFDNEDGKEESTCRL
jgi:hypothetical protein